MAPSTPRSSRRSRPDSPASVAAGAGSAVERAAGAGCPYRRHLPLRWVPAPRTQSHTTTLWYSALLAVAAVLVGGHCERRDVRSGAVPMSGPAERERDRNRRG